jgi:hypothetical protein
MKRPQRRWRRILLGLAIVLVLVAGGLVAAFETGLLLEDTATPVSIAEVVDRFRQQVHSAEGFDGVYVYVTHGEESIDALGGARHRYPRRTSITAVGVRCGLRLHWDALKERTASWTLCTTPRGLELHRFEVSHKFFGQADSTAYACAGSVLLPVDESVGAESPFRCRSDRGREAGEGKVVAFEAVAVAGAQLDAVHVQTVAHVSGGDQGRETTDWWFDVRSGLPLQIGLVSRTSRGFALGDIHYREDATLRLESTKPLR